MYKTILISRYSGGENNIELVDPCRDLIKLAAQGAAGQRMSGKELDKFVGDDKFMWLLVNAMGANPPWPQNTNGDIFPEKALTGMQSLEEGKKNPDGIPKIRYKTFEDGYVFRQHANNSPEKSYGRVIVASWNPRMKRVELVIRTDREKAPDIHQKILSNDDLFVSMGCRVKTDRCSVCGHESKWRIPKIKNDPDAYCDHLLYEMGDIYPDGRQVGAINDTPRFFDISFVNVPADKTAGLLKVLKGSSDVVTITSKDKPTKEPKAEADESEKTAGTMIIIKNVPEPEEPDLPVGNKSPLDICSMLEDGDPLLPFPALKSMAESFPLGKILASFLKNGIVLNPAEFQAVVHCRSGKTDVAEKLFQPGFRFDDNLYDGLNFTDVVPVLKKIHFDLADDVPELSSIIEKFSPKRSIMPDPVIARIKIYISSKPKEEAKPEIEKDASLGILAGTLLPVGLMYLIYRALAAKSLPAVLGGIDDKAANIFKSIPSVIGPVGKMAMGAIPLAIGLKVLTDNPAEKIYKNMPLHEVDQYGRVFLNKHAAMSGGQKLLVQALPIVLGTYMLSAYFRKKYSEGSNLASPAMYVAKSPGNVALGGLAAGLGLKLMKAL